ncbi:SWR1-complex protein 4 [Mucuna pruriens]|uniref:SWR1-complex protein 4 n=1 Tax=Mucuna pruriens TaxID=157652 RepID=A0A371E2J5_MUCPR|nr:SWR1-complex protein 4 [Mucuna pruriens]
MDAKDILGLPKNSFPPLEKKSRPPKESQRKPDGISREVYALTGGLAPLMPAIEASQLKKKSPPLEKITWQWLPFTSSARKDNLHLYHWVRVVNGVPPTGDYSFAKYNKSVDVIKYTDEEYDKRQGYFVIPVWSNDKLHRYIQERNSFLGGALALFGEMWTKEETDQLFDLCERFDLRFVVIADRFPSSRTVEELKDRYYSVSRAVLVARAPSSGDVAAHPLVKEPYNVSQEMERKRALSMVLSQTRQQERRDEEVLVEAKRIAESRIPPKVAEESQVVASNAGAEATERAVPGETISPPNAQLPSMVVPSTLSDNASTLASLRMLRVYLRTYALEQMVQAANSSAGLRTIKRVEQTLQDLGVNLKPRVPTKAVCAEHLELRREILTWLNLQKQVQYKEAEGSSFRDGSYGETPGTPKHLHRGGDQDRTFVPDSMNFGVERVGKKDQKRKAPGAPSAHKRPRKLKASDL